MWNQCYINRKFNNMPESCVLNKLDEGHDNKEGATGKFAVLSSDSDSNKAEATVEYDLTKFKLDSILVNNTRNKSITLLGRFPEVSNTDKCIVIFEKQAFIESDVATNQKSENIDGEGQEKERDNKIQRSYFCADLEVQTEFINDIYGNFHCVPPPNMDGFKATVVYPATDKHIAKYSMSQKYVIKETPELYYDVTLPYITSSQFSLEWVYNILEHKQETDRIIYEDDNPETGFILLPDLKWDGHTLETLYVLAIINKRNIKSLRDLDATHLPLLRNMRIHCAEILEKKYGVLSTQLRMYFHYQPSFYHLHIHINPLRNEAPGIWCEKSHMLDTVINNLELMSNYYKEATLPFVLYEGHQLLELYENKVQIRNIPKPLIQSLSETDVKGDQTDKCTNKNDV